MARDMSYEKNYFEETKYNLDYLGIGGLNKEQLLKYLYTGELPA
jgi:opine dehydrogenase